MTQPVKQYSPDLAASASDSDHEGTKLVALPRASADRPDSCFKYVAPEQAEIGWLACCDEHTALPISWQLCQMLPRVTNQPAAESMCFLRLEPQPLLLNDKT